jgi:hypothetical protein
MRAPGGGGTQISRSASTWQRESIVQQKLPDGHCPS